MNIKVEHGITGLPRTVKPQAAIPADFPVTVCKPGRAHGLERVTHIRAKGGTRLPPPTKKRPKGTVKPRGTEDQMAACVAYLKFGK